MRASDFEFRYRSWVIFLIFLLAFGCYSFERMSTVGWLLSVLGPSGRGRGVYLTSPEAHVIFALGAAIVGLAAIVRTWGTAYLKADVVHDSVVRSERLVADGPYRYLRNPLYFGDMLLAVGFSQLVPPIGCVLLIGGLGLFFIRLVGREESFLLDQQGDAYRAYLEQVPRLWPSLRPRVPAGGAAPRWGQAWKGEMMMWAFFVGSAYFAITFDMKVFEIVIVGSYLLSRVVHQFLRRPVEARRV
jgi:protein-S-isoprenylcysteine O-methyltransferase Ste14